MRFPNIQVVVQLAVLLVASLAAPLSAASDLPEPHISLCDDLGKELPEALVFCGARKIQVISTRGAVDTNQIRGVPTICYRRDDGGTLESILIDGMCDKTTITGEKGKEYRAALQAQAPSVTISCPFPSHPLVLKILLLQGEDTEFELGDCKVLERTEPERVCPPPDEDQSPARKT